MVSHILVDTLYAMVFEKWRPYQVDDVEWNSLAESIDVFNRGIYAIRIMYVIIVIDVLCYGMMYKIKSVKMNILLIHTCNYNVPNIFIAFRFMCQKQNTRVGFFFKYNKLKMAYVT